MRSSGVCDCLEVAPEFVLEVVDGVVEIEVEEPVGLADLDLEDATVLELMIEWEAEVEVGVQVAKAVDLVDLVDLVDPE